MTDNGSEVRVEVAMLDQDGFAGLGLLAVASATLDLTTVLGCCCGTERKGWLLSSVGKEGGKNGGKLKATADLWFGQETVVVAKGIRSENKGKILDLGI